jgi:hypothetical protein
MNQKKVSVYSNASAGPFKPNLQRLVAYSGTLFPPLLITSVYYRLLAVSCNIYIGRLKLIQSTG